MRLAPLLVLFLAACVTTPEPPPAQSYAWVAFDRDSVLAGESHGLADTHDRRSLTLDDPVRIASISKLVVAIGVMRLVEQGRLDLDRDVSEWLGWSLRNPAFPDEPITLRLLLSHQSSLRDEVDYAIPLGGSVKDTLAAEAAFDPHHRPGTYFRYSNLNFPVVATVMEAATGERFDLLMDRLVIAPLGIDACFNWPGCSDAAIARAAALHAADGTPLRDDLKGRRPDCPVVPAADGGCDWRSYRPGTNGALFSPQGGLRISARDLAVVGRLLLNEGLHDGRPILSEAAVAEMLAPQWRYDGTNGETDGGFYCAYGLATQILPNDRPGCGDDLFGDGRAAVGHAGDAYGLRSGLWIDRQSGRGTAYFATGIAQDAPRGGSAYRTIEEWLARRSTPGR